MTDISAFIEKAVKAKKDNTRSDFMTEMSKSDDFMCIVAYIMETTRKWSESVGLVGTKKKEDPAISDEEKMWKKYFSDHSFDSAQTSRNMADLVKNLTGIDCGRFIKISSRSMKESFFPRWVAIVPTGNNNDHNYRLGVAAICFRDGSNLLKPDATTGNNMTTDLDHLRVPTRDEVVFTLSGIFYNSTSLLENISITVLSSL